MKPWKFWKISGFRPTSGRNRTTSGRNLQGLQANFKKINLRWTFTEVYKQNFKKIPISPFSDPNWPSFLPLYLKYLEKFREKSADIRFRSVHLPSKGDKHLAKKPVNYCRKHEELEPFTTVNKHSTSNLCHFRFPPGGATCQNSKNKVPWGPLVIPSKKHRCSRTLRSRVIKLSAHTKK